MVKRRASVKWSHWLRSLEGGEILFLAVSAAGSPARENMSKVTVSSVGSELRILDEVGKKCRVILSVRPRGASQCELQVREKEPHRSPKIDCTKSHTHNKFVPVIISRKFTSLLA